MTGYLHSMRRLARHGATAPSRLQGFGPPQPPMPASVAAVMPMASPTAVPSTQSAMAPATPRYGTSVPVVEPPRQSVTASEPSTIGAGVSKVADRPRESVKRTASRTQSDQNTPLQDLAESVAAQGTTHPVSNIERSTEILHPPSVRPPDDRGLELSEPAMAWPGRAPDVRKPKDLEPLERPRQTLQYNEATGPAPSASVGPKPIAAKSEHPDQLADAGQDVELNVSAPPFAQAGVPNQQPADPSRSFELMDAPPRETLQSYPDREPDRVKLGPAKLAGAVESRVDVHIGRISIDMVPDTPVAPAPPPRRSVKSAPGQGIFSGQRDLARSYVRRL